MRGKPQSTITRFSKDRNIPAYAGKTDRLATPPNIPTEHPRVCGENLGLSRYVAGITGTSPRMRGKQSRPVSRRSRGGEHPRVCGENETTNIPTALGDRNIPAYAGKTRVGELKSFLPEEHPRVCGENHRHANSKPYIQGTSPRMRGKLELSEAKI